MASDLVIDQVMQEFVSPPLLLLETFKLAHTSPYGRFRVGSIIAKRKNILSYGVNQKKTHPIQARFSRRQHLAAWLHAETHAISNANAGALMGSDCYVARVLMDGSWGNSRPCEGCMDALKHYGVRRTIYYCDGSFIRETI